MSHDAPSTSDSLINQVRRLETEAWRRLSALYGPLVYRWCRQRGWQSDDAADVVQEVFRSVFQSIGQFRGGSEHSAGGSFRGWLWVITRNQLRLKARQGAGRPRAVGGTDMQLQFAECADGATVIEVEEPEPDAEATRIRLLHRALELIRGDFNASTWTAFERITLHDHSISEVAAELGLTENAVRQAKFRVLRRLREELNDT